MKLALKFFLTVCLLLATIGCKKEKALAIGKSAPSITVMDLKEQRVRLSDFLGKVVVVRFWQEGCPACLTEMPKLDEFYKKHKDNLVILAIFVGKNKKFLRKFQQDLKLAFPMTIDEVKIAASKYEMKVSPTSFIVDRKGVLRSKVIGDTDMQNFYKKLLNYF